jgi:tetratricopeptide (TPR) repeat protein
VAQLQSGAVFAGRDRELRDLLEVLTESAAGHGHLILLGGEPGIGKSRLADELAARARERGHQVLWGRGWEDAGAPPYWLWVQALRTHLRSTAVDELRQQIGSGAADVAQMLPELRDLFPDLPPPPDAASESARFQLFDSTATLLRNAARARPLLVVLDDLQAADIPSILFLRFLASQLSDMATLVVATYRDVELTREHPLTAAIAELDREPVTRVMALAGLDSAAVAEYIGATADIVPHDQLVAAVLRATSGNPLFVGEAVRLLSAEGRLTEVADLPSLRIAVPAGVRAVIAKRISHLDQATGRALALGAALGPEFGLEVLRRIGDFDADQALDLIDEAVEAGLLLPVAGVLGRYRFSHDLVRETLYDELSPGRRVRLHRRIAEVLEDLYAGPSGGHLAELAFHYVQAARQGEGASMDGDVDRMGAKAIDYARRAGDDAARSLAFEEAARLYSMALAVLDLDGVADDGSRAETLLVLGDVLARAGDLDAARSAFLEAADIAQRTGDGPQLARAALGFGGRHHWARPGNDTRLISLLQDALVMLGGDDERLRARLLTRVACAWRSSPERRNDSAILSRQAIQIARQLDDPAVLSYVLVGGFWATWWPENPDDRHDIATELLGRAATDGDGERIADAHFLAMLSLSERGRIPEARRELATLSRIIADLRQPAQLWIEPDNRVWLALLEGDFRQAQDLLAAKAESTYRVTAGRDDLSSARMHRFLLSREQGRVADEESIVRDSVVDFPWYPFHRAALACALLDLDREEEARVAFDDLARDEFRALYRDNEWLLGMSLASEACAVLRDAAAAETLYEQLAPFAGRHALGYSEGSVGAVDRYLGLLAATRGRLDDAVRHLAAAIEVNDRMGARPWTAHSQHDLADVLRRRDEPGDRARAAELDETSLAIARTLGMALATRIEALPEVASPPPASPQAPLTTATFRREGEYWTIEFELDTFRLRDSKGMGHLARLLEAPGREIHALEFSRLEASPRGAPLRPREVDVVDGIGDAGAVLDAEAKAAYRRRLADIRADLAQAEEWNDPERIARLQAEERALTHELAAALGLGGRDRAVGSPAERARVSVTRAIRTALGRIAEQSESLGEHLDATIRTGTFCSYVPDPRAPITWRLSHPPRADAPAPQDP